MKSKSTRDMILFSIIGALALGVMISLAVRWEGNLPDYSVLNKSPKGFSVYMETLQEIGVNAGQIIEPVESQSLETVQILSTKQWFDSIEAPALKWVQDGGTLVLAAQGPQGEDPGWKLISDKDGLRIFQVGMGRILTITAASLTNRAIGKDALPSWNLTTEIMNLGDVPVRFNELALYPSTIKPSLWKAAPLWMKLTMYQLLIVAGAWFWMKGNRLGTPVPFGAETERTQLEYLNAAAHFYQSAGCWDLMLKVYFRRMVHTLGAREDNWLEIWKHEGLPDLQKAQALDGWMESLSSGPSHKEIQQQIMVIEHLNDVIRNRRHSPWSMLKQR